MVMQRRIYTPRGNDVDSVDSEDEEEEEDEDKKSFSPDTTRRSTLARNVQVPADTVDNVETQVEVPPSKKSKLTGLPDFVYPSSSTSSSSCILPPITSPITNRSTKRSEEKEHIMDLL